MTRCMLNTHLHHLILYRTKYYLPRHKGYANEIELDDSSTNVQSLSIIQNPALVAKPYGMKELTRIYYDTFIINW
jgi:hypothetical protein